MARELQLNGRRYWIISDPHGPGWKARVVELHEGGEADEIGIEASDQTRTAADDSAERKLRRLLRLPLTDCSALPTADCRLISESSSRRSR